jgi:hypothetical protein
MGYLKKNAILQAYKQLSQLSDDPTVQGATQKVSAIRYFLALDKFYKAKSRDCDTRQADDKADFSNLVGDVCSVCLNLYTPNFYYPLKSHTGDFSVGSNFYSAGQVSASLVNPVVTMDYPKRGNKPLFRVLNGVLKRDSSLYCNFTDYVESQPSFVALVIWLLRKEFIPSDGEDFYDSIYSILEKTYTNDLISIIFSNPTKFKSELTKYDLSLNGNFYSIKDEDIKTLFDIIPEDADKDNRADYQKYENLLLAKKNLVLTGAPGTGKTYIAKQVAASIVSDGSADWSGLSADQREQVGFVQFHPSFDYTDFVEGLRPDKDGNFSRQDGIFKEFCKKAIKNPDNNFVFIIDEINRGELSKIFGELFYSIEPDYRGLEGRVKTQYINMVEDDDKFKEGFYIPENVYIIGTMNDVDRGVEAMDFAIRRRFAWKEVTAEESATNMGITGTALAKMNKINEVIKEKLGQAYCIGGAYFRKLDGDNFADLWDNHLCGIVTEYFRGEPEADARIAEIKAAYDAAEEKKEESNLAPAPAEAETTPAAE